MTRKSSSSSWRRTPGRPGGAGVAHLPSYLLVEGVDAELLVVLQFELVHSCLGYGRRGRNEAGWGVAGAGEPWEDSGMRVARAGVTGEEAGVGVAGT